MYINNYICVCDSGLCHHLSLLDVSLYVHYGKYYRMGLNVLVSFHFLSLVYSVLGPLFIAAIAFNPHSHRNMWFDNQRRATVIHVIRITLRIVLLKTTCCFCFLLKTDKSFKHRRMSSRSESLKNNTTNKSGLPTRILYGSRTFECWKYIIALQSLNLLIKCRWNPPLTRNQRIVNSCT